MSENNTTTTQQQQMVRGTAWLTASNFLSRLLGAFYIIPWYAWMGTHAEQANALFGMGYNIYAVFLLISTAGIPVAIAKQVSKYNALGQEETSYHLLRKILKLTSILGLIFAAIMYLGSPLLAAWSGGGEDLVRVMKSLSWALLIFPSMSVLRGFFQGFNNLKPYAMSQIAEQIIRVIWMLLTAYIIMNIGSGDYVNAVVQSTFAAFIGMIASVLVLVVFLWREGKWQAIFAGNTNDVTVDTQALILETIKEAIPFIITGAAIQLFQIVDQMSFINTMTSFTSYSNKDLQILYAFLSSNPNKITMILVSIATAIAGAGIPLLTENFVNKDKKAAAQLVVNNLQMLWMVLFPALVGAIILAEPIYTLFYGAPSNTALWLFVGALIQVIFLALYSLLAPMLQALFEPRKAILYFVYGLVVKIVLQIPFIYVFQAYGPLISTAIGLAVPIVLMYRRIHEVTGFNRQGLRRSILLMTLLALIMGVVVAIAAYGLHFAISPTTRLGSVVYIALVGAIGVLVYGFLTLATHLLDKLIGTRAKTLRQKLHLP
ncbi:putative polysaccharide biosynthesis protein [Streptococcus alactolyticus]|jgi:O-antigen/teichoic acid export membrane protein|uniref:Polysaccharide biosynthesis protein n=1 Tax=Streptococcus alactolyticus TaxID=29389 RepID=A0A6N7WNF0_STRAY|nr:MULTISPECIES: polysaccharide biosynthesis protein [Streptococcus]MCF2665645.1 polysaccharide biosynthesis protein [Streptococcus alactolyticus]MCF2678094.1 polysaccharide biosynthesis protein [Streptococcus alactolyticus]MCI6904715.1 polysaccharide biosynthesis protein [Streptococcus alactolyticus]MDD7361405.1 polysaccharide biosynthesis protein [Streptococcus alactolyticus]MDY5187320.1 polysaccharide biosynthesis protein [Streptococcus alactolyticus]